MKKELFNNRFESDITQVKTFIKINLKDSNPRVENLLSKLPADEGKLIRALFVMIGGAFGHGSREALVKIAAAIELLHLATLVHDDIIDDTDMRRGRTAIHKQYNIKSAIFAGDYLFSQAYVIFSNNCTSHSVREVSQTIKVICSSEISQFFSLYSLQSSVKSYLSRINGKCASLFSLSLSIGAFEGNTKTEVVKNLKDIGYFAGMAFQLIDDILDFTSSEDKLGKPTGNDIKQGIYNLPIIYELKDQNVELLELLKKNNMEKAIELVKASHGMEKAKLAAEKYTYRAIERIKKLPDIEEKEILNSIIEKLLVRNF